jgi:hypothetical protein
MVAKGNKIYKKEKDSDIGYIWTDILDGKELNRNSILSVSLPNTRFHLLCTEYIRRKGRPKWPAFYQEKSITICYLYPFQLPICFRTLWVKNS